MIDIQYNHTTTSTNDLAAKCSEQWTIFISEEQTNSRGQRGSSWESEPMKNLTFSLLLTPTFLPASKQFYISKIVSLSIAYLLEELDLTPKIKWPNDIYVGDKKICGILIENTLSSSGEISKSVIGVGLNVNQREFLSDAPNPVSIINLTNEEQNRNEILNRFALHIYKLYNLLEEENYLYIDQEYIKYLYRYNIVCRYRTADKHEFMGRIIDVLPQGDLIVEDAKGEQNSYLFKEIEFIIDNL